MHPKKWLMLTINILGGAAVLGSYVWGFQTYPGAGNVLWGGVPENVRPFYTANMFVAAAGYFAFVYFTLFRLSPTDTRVFGRFGFGIFNLLYAAILAPSALWMPLLLLAVEQASPAFVWLVRFVLAVIGMASLGLFFSLLKVEPARPRWAQRLAVSGSIGFCIQTVLLDAVIWGALFPF
jgi:hypothetical protein